MTERVLFLEPDARLASDVAGQLSGALESAGHECLRCDVGHASERPSGNQAATIRRARPMDLAAVGRLRQLVNEFRPHVVYVMSGDADALALMGTCRHKCQVVLQRSVALNRWERVLRPREVSYLASSESARQRLLKTAAAPMSTSLAAPLAFGDELAARSKSSIASELAIPLDAKLIGVVASLEERDRIRDVIWVGDLLKVVRYDTHVLIFGDGPQRIRLERFRRNVEIADRVHFVGTPDELPAWLPALDLYWCAAGGDSISRGLCEAVRIGLPVIASDTAAHREMVVDDQNGYLFPLGNRAHFGRHSLRVLEESGLAERLGAAGKLYWDAEFSWQQQLNRFLQAHDQLSRQTQRVA